MPGKSQKISLFGMHFPQIIPSLASRPLMRRSISPFSDFLIYIYEAGTQDTIHRTQDTGHIDPPEKKTT